MAHVGCGEATTSEVCGLPNQFDNSARPVFTSETNLSHYSITTYLLLRLRKIIIVCHMEYITSNLVPRAFLGGKEKKPKTGNEFV